jgi:hypothetical protein
MESKENDKENIFYEIGPYFLGKSTLMNLVFGIQFFVSLERCSNRIYFTF